MCRRDTWGLGCVFHGRMRAGCCTEKGVGFFFFSPLPLFLLVGSRSVGWRGTGRWFLFFCCEVRGSDLPVWPALLAAVAREKRVGLFALSVCAVPFTPQLINPVCLSFV